MRRFDLQLCAAPEAVQGKKIVYLYRILSSATTKDGATLAFTTENGRTKSMLIPQQLRTDQFVHPGLLR